MVLELFSETFEEEEEKILRTRENRQSANFVATSGIKLHFFILHFREFSELVVQGSTQNKLFIFGAGGGSADQLIKIKSGQGVK